MEDKQFSIAEKNIRCSHKETLNLGHTNELSKTKKIQIQKCSNSQRSFRSERANFPAQHKQFPKYDTKEQQNSREICLR